MQDMFVCSEEADSSKQGCSGAGRWREDVLPALDQLQLHHGWPVQESLQYLLPSEFFCVLVSTYVGLSSPA